MNSIFGIRWRYQTARGRTSEEWAPSGVHIMLEILFGSAILHTLYRAWGGDEDK